jgi:hypothetical protein
MLLAAAPHGFWSFCEKRDVFITDNGKEAPGKPGGQGDDSHGA